MRWRVVLLVLFLSLGAVGQRALAVTSPGFVTCPEGTEARLWDYSYQCWNPATSSYVQPLVYEPPAAIPGQSGEVFCGGEYWAVSAGELGAELWCSEAWLFGPGIDGLQLPEASAELTPEQMAALMGAMVGILAVAFAWRVVIRAAPSISGR